MPLYNLDRAVTVSRFLKLEVNRRDELQQIVNLAAEICNTQMALITLVDEQMQYIQFQTGFEDGVKVLNDEFCQYTILSDNVFEVHDALEDTRFFNNALVTGDPNLRFYAGARLSTRDGYMLGCLSVINCQPGSLSENQKKMLLTLCGQIIQIIEFDLSISLLKDQVNRLQLSEIKLKSFFESTVSCHLLIGTELEVLAYNRFLADFVQNQMNLQIREKMDICEFVHEDYLEEFLGNYKAALSGQVIQGEKELTYSNGRTVYWYICFEPACGSGTDIIGVSLNATDITERIQQEQIVFKQNEALRNIAFVQSHELRRPVSSILGIVELIKSETVPEDINEEIMMLDLAAKELDGKIREVISLTN